MNRNGIIWSARRTPGWGVMGAALWTEDRDESPSTLRRLPPAHPSLDFTLEMWNFSPFMRTLLRMGDFRAEGWLRMARLYLRTSCLQTECDRGGSNVVKESAEIRGKTLSEAIAGED